MKHNNNYYNNIIFVIIGVTKSNESVKNICMRSQTSWRQFLSYDDNPNVIFSPYLIHLPICIEIVKIQFLNNIKLLL